MDTLFIRFHVCGKKLATKTVEHDETLPAWLVIRWHEKAIAHVRRDHSRRKVAR